MNTGSPAPGVVLWPALRFYVRPLEALRAALRQPHVGLLLAIMVAGLVIRVVWVSTVQPDPRDGRFDDSVWYFHTARLLADGEGYVFPGNAFCQFGDGISCDERPPAALWAPGYPLALAATFLVPGDDLVAARALNVAAGVALIAGVYYLGRRLWDVRAGLLAAAVIAFLPSHVFFSSLVLSETLSAAMVVGLLCLAVAWTIDREPTPRGLVGLGLAAGALALVRPEGMVFAFVIVLAWLLVRRSWRQAGLQTALLVLGMAAVLAPWVVRNEVQLDSPIIGTTGLGQVVLQAHHPAADGEPEYLIAAELWGEHSDKPLPQREIDVNRDGLRKALTYAIENPGRELDLIPDRFASFYRGDRGAITWNRVGDGEGQSAIDAEWGERWGVISDVYYYAVLGIGLIGLPLWLRRMGARHVLLWGPIALYSAMWAFLFVGESRYHFPLLPFFALFAGIGLAALAERLRGERPSTP